MGGAQKGCFHPGKDVASIPMLQTLEVYWFHRTKGRRARTHRHPENWRLLGPQGVDALQLTEFVFKRKQRRTRQHQFVKWKFSFEL